MASPIEDLIAALIRRERMGRSLGRELSQREQKLFREIAELFTRIDPPGAARSRYRRERLARFLDELGRKLKAHAPELERYMRDRLALIGRAEAVAARGDLLGTLGAESALTAGITTPVTQARMRAILNTDPFMGRTLREHAQRISANTLDQVRAQVRFGMTAEESIPQIVRRIRGTPYQASRLQVEALARTAVTEVSNVAALQTYQENATVVAGVRFLATLDDRTTEVCMAYDGTVWPLGDKDIQQPPLHYGCRSILVPEIDYEKLGLPAPPDGFRSARDLDTIPDEVLRERVSRRRGPTGLGEVRRVRSGTTAEQWFRGQRAAVQNKMIGPTRAAAFRRGEIGSLRELITRDNRLLRLDELGLE